MIKIIGCLFAVAVLFAGCSESNERKVISEAGNPNLSADTNSFNASSVKQPIESIADFKDTSTFPLLYSCREEDDRKSFGLTEKEQLSPEQIKALLTDLELPEGGKVFPLHVVKEKDFKLATYLIEDDDIPCYYDRLVLVSYDNSDNLKKSFERVLLYDDYGSYNEILLKSTDTVIVRFSDLEYSPDEEQYEEDLKTGYVFVPEVEEQLYLLQKDSLNFELSDKRNISE